MEISIPIIIAIITGSLIIIALSREISCWYFKINERNDLLREQNRLLKKLVGEDKSSDIDDPNAHWKCPKCGSINKNSTYTCINCDYKIN